MIAATWGSDELHKSKDGVHFIHNCNFNVPVWRPHCCYVTDLLTNFICVLFVFMNPARIYDYETLLLHLVSGQLSSQYTVLRRSDINYLCLQMATACEGRTIIVSLTRSSGNLPTSRIWIQVLAAKGTSLIFYSYFCNRPIRLVVGSYKYVSKIWMIS